jgi:hypothetical protein
VVVRYRIHLEECGLAANTINQQLAAVRRLAYEAADAGLLRLELAAGINRVKGVKQPPQRGLSCFSGRVCTSRLSRKQITAVRASRSSRSASNPVDMSPVLSRPPAPPKAALRDLARTARACRRSPELRPSLEGPRDLATQPMPMMRSISLDNCCKIALDERKIPGCSHSYSSVYIVWGASDGTH